MKVFKEKNGQKQPQHPVDKGKNSLIEEYKLKVFGKGRKTHFSPDYKQTAASPRRRSRPGTTEPCCLEVLLSQEQQARALPQHPPQEASPDSPNPG